MELYFIIGACFLSMLILENIYYSTVLFLSYSLSDMQSMILHTYSIIVAATRNFSLSQLIGEGGFGKVYSGNIQSTMSAIKVLSVSINQLWCNL